MSFDNRPIGVFDSGIGGITVLRELVKHFPKESFIYLGDTARLPYGSKSGDTVRQYSVQNMKYLVSRDVKAIVVACNTASTQVSEHVFENCPVYNVMIRARNWPLRKPKIKKSVFWLHVQPSARMPMLRELKNICRQRRCLIRRVRCLCL